VRLSEIVPDVDHIGVSLCFAGNSKILAQPDRDVSPYRRERETRGLTAVCGFATQHGLLLRYLQRDCAVAASDRLG